MLTPLLLRVTPEADGRWRVLVGGMLGRLSEGLVPRTRVDTILAALLRWETLRPRAVAVPGQDAEFRRAEEDLGRALVRMFGDAQELAQRFATELGAARQQGEPLIVLVDIDDLTQRRIPWELLALGPEGVALEEARAGIVTRLVGGAARGSNLPDYAGVEAAVWCPTPADPVCAEVLTALDATLRRFEAGPARRIDPRDPDSVPPSSGSIVLHVVCHGRRDADEVRLLLGADSAGPPAAVARLGDWFAAADTLILDVCEAGSATDHLLDALPGRFVACGARAVIAPTRRCSYRSAIAFTFGFYKNWTEGRSLAEATAGGRNEVAALALGLPDTRWYNHVLYVPDAQAATRAGPQPAIWRPEGWPRARREAEELLQLAKELADRDGQGFVGVEHLALAVAAGAGAGPLTGQVRLALTQHVTKLAKFKDGMRVNTDGYPPDARGTLRLRSWARRLKAGFSSDDVWRIVVEDRGHLLQFITEPPLWHHFQATAHRTPVPGDRTLPGELLPPPGMGDQTLEGPIVAPPPVHHGPAFGLQVASGPEDGRVFRLQPGERFGRAPTPIGLYHGTFMVDRSLHRGSLVWLGPGRVRVEDRFTLRTSRKTEPREAGEVWLEVGDVLQLTAATWLRGIGPEPVPVEAATKADT